MHSQHDITIPRLMFILDTIDWSGHVELGDSDKRWLANQLHAALSPNAAGICASCGESRAFVVSTSVGNICDECLDTFSDMLDLAKEDAER